MLRYSHMPQKTAWLLPAAIVIAGALVGVSLFFVRANSGASDVSSLGALRPITTEDHIVGSPSADVVIVEYSDIDCRYCKAFRSELEELMGEYAASGRVAWVYRHLPLTTSDPNGATHAEAAECAASLGGPRAFFEFIRALNAAAPGTDRFDPTDYDRISTALGLSVSEFDSCMAGSAFEEKVARDYKNALRIGANGAPYSVVIARGQKPVPISGALPYAALKKVVDDALAKIPE